MLSNGEKGLPTQGGVSTLSPHLTQGSHLESASGVVGMELDLQSVVDNGDMTPEAVTDCTMTTLGDNILPLPGTCTRGIRTCSEERIARDNGCPGTSRVTLGSEGETSWS